MDSLCDKWLIYIFDSGLTELINKRMNLGYSWLVDSKRKYDRVIAVAFPLAKEKLKLYYLLAGILNIAYL